LETSDPEVFATLPISKAFESPNKESAVFLGAASCDARGDAPEDADPYMEGGIFIPRVRREEELLGR
jgi:hypothetical protein